MKTKIPDFVKLVTTVDLTDLDLPWNGFGGKAEFHKWGKTVAKEIAKVLELPKVSYDVRSNMGGVAVSGEITLHSDNLYIQFSQTIPGQFMFRSCNGRRDFTGGPNRWMAYSNLLNLDDAVQKFKTV